MISSIKKCFSSLKCPQVAKRSNPLERQTYTYSNLRWELRKQVFERTHEALGTPSPLALLSYISVVVILGFGAYHFDLLMNYGYGWIQLLQYKLHILIAPESDQIVQLIQAPIRQAPPAKGFFSDISYLPTIITGISTFGFALLFFVAELIRDKGFNPTSRTIIHKTLIFPLVVSSVTAFTILVFFPTHPYILSVLCLYLGGMALVATFHLFQWIWVRGESPEGGGIPAIKSLYHLFLYETYIANVPTRFKFLNQWRERKKNKLKNKFEVLLDEFIEGLLIYQSPKDVEYMVYFGRMLVHIRYILTDNDFVENKVTTVPTLISPYLQKLLFHDSEITKLVKREKTWIRRAAYLAITNAELALEVNDKNAIGYCLTMITALYGILGSQDKLLRDGFLEIICRWINEFSDYYVEPKLFKTKNIIEHQKILHLAESILDAYSGLIYRSFESGVDEGSNKNFRAILSTYSEILDDYLRGGYGADRDIKRLAEAAEYWLKNPEYAEKKPEEYKNDIEINRAREGFELTKKGLLVGIGAIIFHDMNGKYKDKEDVAEDYLHNIFSSVVISVETLLPIYLNLPNELDDQFWLDTYIRPPVKPGKPKVYSLPNVLHDLLHPAIVFVLLRNDKVVIPVEIKDLLIKGDHKYRLENLMKLLEKIEGSEAPWWKQKLEAPSLAKVPLLLTLVKKLYTEAEGKALEEMRNAAMPSDADRIFKTAVMEGYGKRSPAMRVLSKMGLVINDQVQQKYAGKVSRIGFTHSHRKDGLLSDQQIQFIGKQYGEMTATEEGRLVFKQILKRIPKADVSLEVLTDKIASEDNLLIVADHIYWFDALLRSQKFQKFFSLPKKDDPLSKEYGDIFRGYLSIKDRLYPVVTLHQDALHGKLLVLKKGEIGSLYYFSAEPYGEPTKDPSISPLFARLVAFSEDEQATQTALKSKKTLPEFKTKEEKINKLKEIVSTQVLFRFDVEPNPMGIKVYKLSLKGKLGNRRVRRKKTQKKQVK